MTKLLLFLSPAGKESLDSGKINARLHRIFQMGATSVTFSHFFDVKLSAVNASILK